MASGYPIGRGRWRAYWAMSCLGPQHCFLLPLFLALKPHLCHDSSFLSRGVIQFLNWRLDPCLPRKHVFAVASVEFKAPLPAHFGSLFSHSLAHLCHHLHATILQVKSQILEVPPVTPQDSLGVSQMYLVVPVRTPGPPAALTSL